MTETSGVWFSELEIEYRFVYENEINRGMWPMVHDFIIFRDSCFFPEPSTYWRAISYCWNLNYGCCCWFNWFHSSIDISTNILNISLPTWYFLGKLFCHFVTKGLSSCVLIDSSGKFLVFWALHNEVHYKFPAAINLFWILVFWRSLASAVIF